MEMYQRQTPKKPTFQGVAWGLADLQAMPPAAWCRKCGAEVYKKGEFLCEDCKAQEREERSANRELPPPCVSCIRVADPWKCENKRCKPWREWFIGQWEAIHSYPRRAIENAGFRESGVPLGGRRYDAPHRVREYLCRVPCEKCGCDKSLCASPCKALRAWEKQKGDACGLEN